MRKFIIGEWWREGDGRNPQKYEQYKQELRDKLGVDFIGGFAPHHIAEKDGYFFERWNGDDEEPYLRINALPAHPDGEAMCHCGGMKFSITYGNYQCLGTCVDCKKTYELYDG